MNVMMAKRATPIETDKIVIKILSTWGLRSKIADACGIRPQNINQWKRVPAHWVHNVSEIMNLTPEQIRPDIFRKK